MTTVIGVSFKRAGKMYYFDPNGLELHTGDQVIVETARGMECGDVVTDLREVPDEEVVQPLKAVIRVATDEDRRRIAVNLRKEAEAFEIGQARIAHHQLEMKLVDVEYTFDVSKIIFYFTANGRIDFRELVKDLASIFKTRIELRQIGVRDEAKMIGGLGSCGRPICCRTFLGDFQPVSIKMAKEQNLLLNPTKISGLCGRLMCCLKYEQDTYDEVYKRTPRVGEEVITPDGRGTVAEIAVIREKIKVRIPVKDGVTEFREYDFDQVQLAPKDGAPVPAPAPADKPEPAEPQPGDAPEQPDEQAAEPNAPAQPEGEPAPRADRPPRSRSRGGRGRNRGQSGENPRPEEPKEPREPREKGDKPDKPDKGDRPPRPPRPPRGNRGGQRRDNAPGGEGKPEGGKPGEPKPENRPQEGGRNGEQRPRNRSNRPPRRDATPGGVRTIPKEQRPAPAPAQDSPVNP